MKTFTTLLKNEIKLSIRGMDMVIFAICFPAIMVILLGIIFGQKPAFEGANYTFLEQSFGAISSIAICAGGVMGFPLLISDYRQKKILKRYHVTPIRPSMILTVHGVIYSLYSLCSLLLTYLLSYFIFKARFQGSFLLFLGSYLLVMLSMFSIGMMVGGLAKDSKSAGMIASILYFPMLIFSGATLPYEVMPKALQKVVDILPLTQGIKLLKSASLGLPINGVFIPILLMIVIMIVCIFIAVRAFKWE